MNKYSGIDLHSNNCVVAVIDDTDRVCCQRRMPNDMAQIVALLAPYREELVGVVVESAYNWYWLVDGLQQAGYQVKLANTTAIAQYDGLKYSGDEYDARHLAHLLRLGILRAGYIYPKEMRSVRDLARKRSQLVRTRTMHVLAVENLVARQTGGRISGNAVKQRTAQAVDQWGWVPDTALAVQANVMVMNAVNDVIAQIEHAYVNECACARSMWCSRPHQVLEMYWLPRSCWRPARSSALPKSATSPLTHAASTVPATPMARRRAKATARTATDIWRGRLSKQHTLRCVTTQRPNVFTTARRPRPMRWSLSKRWRTNWRAPVITC
jgi:hypothetical protein